VQVRTTTVSSTKPQSKESRQMSERASPPSLILAGAAMIILGLQYWREKRAQTALQMALLKVNSLHRRSCALEKALLAADTRASSRMLRWAEEQHLQIGAAMMISVRIMQWRRRMLRKRAQTTLPTGETAAAPAAARKGPLSLACINRPASEEFIVLRSLSSSHLTEESSSSPLRATPASPLIRSPLGFSPRLERRAHSQLECIIQESAEASPTPETDQAALDLYSKYAGDECLPIEVVTNLALLLLKARRVIQFDMGFTTRTRKAAYTPSSTARAAAWAPTRRAPSTRWRPARATSSST